MSDINAQYEPPASALFKWQAFTGAGTAAIAVGDTITGATSAATAVVTKVHVSAGTFAGGDAEGALFVQHMNGTFTAGELLNTSTQSGIATLTGAFMALDTLISAVASIDNTPPTPALAASPPFEISRFGFSNAMIQINSLASGTTDNLVVELFGSIDGTFQADLDNQDADRTREVTGATTAKDTNWEITDFPFPWAMLRVKSAGGTDTFTVTAKMRRWRFADEPPIQD